MERFTDEQQAFLAHDPRQSGRLIAGPGAGKSFTCVAYIRQAVARGLRPRMLTFTRAAAAEFAETMSTQGVEAIHPPGTIHSFALQILRETRWPGVPQPVRIADTWETKELIHEQLSRLLRGQGHDQATPGRVEKLEEEMSAGFESLSDPLESEHTPALRHAYLGLWDQHRARLGYLLRGELPYRAGAAIEDIGLPDLHLDVLVVDEYQDVNRADIKLLHHIASAGIPVVAVGDEDQSIYGYRHAHPEGIRRFPEDFQTESDYRLTLSRRCGSAILDPAQSLMEGAPGRPLQPRMRAYDEAKPGVTVYLRFPNQRHEASAVARIISARIEAGVPPHKIAVLVRGGASSWAGAMKWALDERNIAIASDAWVREGLKDPGFRRVRALALLASDLGDSLAWMTLLCLTHRIGDTALDRLYHAAQPGETFAEVVQRAQAESIARLGPAQTKLVRDAIRKVMVDLQAFEIPEAPPDGGWGAWLLQRATEPLSADATRLLDLVSRRSIPGGNLNAFIAQIEPLGKDFALSEQDAVRFMAMGASKGLTMDSVAVLGVEAGNIPMPAPKGDPEEERRLLYVAMTRATDYCILTMCRFRQGPVARRGAENLNARSRSPLLEGILAPQDGDTWIAENGF